MERSKGAVPIRRRASRATLVSALALLTAGAAVGSRADSVQGQVTLPNKRPAENAVVTLEGAQKSPPPIKAVIDQRYKTFIPHVTVVPCGSTILFPNNDTVFHNVFAYYDAKKFDLGMYPRGATKSVVFDKPGVVALLCNVHSDMSAYILVVDTPYYGVTDRQGRFLLKDVPPGRYELRVWHESGTHWTQTLQVGGGNSAPLPLTLARK
jgi:plastocyanin